VCSQNGDDENDTSLCISTPNKQTKIALRDTAKKDKEKSEQLKVEKKKMTRGR
jgi:hypothetical protein